MRTDIIIFIFGLFACMIIGVLALMLLYILIGALVETIRNDYIEHGYKETRGKPRAKCYCCDCEFYNVDTHLCKKHGYGRYAVDHFCRDATPMFYNKYAAKEKKVDAIGGDSK